MHRGRTRPDLHESLDQGGRSGGVYDLYLHASPKSYASEWLRANAGLLQVATQRAPDFAEA